MQIVIAAVLLVGFSMPTGEATALAAIQTEKLNSETSGDEALASTVGFPKLILQYKIAGSKVIAKPITPTQPMVVRIVETFPHGSDFRYDLEYKGLEPGNFDLAQFLMREDGSDQLIPPIQVRIDAILPPASVRPSPLDAVQNRFRSYYVPVMIGLAIFWVAGLLMILLYGRTWKTRSRVEEKPVTVADRMRPLVDAAMAGKLTSQQQAELERLLSVHWSKKLELGHLTADELRTQLRRHEAASVMLNQIDSWLHRPVDDPANEVDVNELLRPYRGDM
jgi:hypothetical protein